MPARTVAARGAVRRGPNREVLPHGARRRHRGPSLPDDLPARPLRRVIGGPLVGQALPGRQPRHRLGADAHRAGSRDRLGSPCARGDDAPARHRPEHGQVAPRVGRRARRPGQGERPPHAVLAVEPAAGAGAAGGGGGHEAQPLAIPARGRGRPRRAAGRRARRADQRRDQPAGADPRRAPDARRSPPSRRRHASRPRPDRRAFEPPAIASSTGGRWPPGRRASPHRAMSACAACALSTSRCSTSFVNAHAVAASHTSSGVPLEAVDARCRRVADLRGDEDDTGTDTVDGLVTGHARGGDGHGHLQEASDAIGHLRGGLGGQHRRRRGRGAASAWRAPGRRRGRRRTSSRLPPPPRAPR